MSEFSLVLQPDEIDSIKEDLNDRSLKAPTAEQNPTFKPGRAEGLGTWEEVVKINDVVITPAKDQPNIPVVKVVFEVLGEKDGGFSHNAGRNHWENLYVDAGAYLNPNDEKHDKARRTVGILLSLVDAAGVERDGAFDLLKCLHEKVVQGQVVRMVVNKWSFIDKQTQTTVKRCNAVGFNAITA